MSGRRLNNVFDPMLPENRWALETGSLVRLAAALYVHREQASGLRGFYNASSRFDPTPRRVVGRGTVGIFLGRRKFERADGKGKVEKLCFFFDGVLVVIKDASAMPVTV